MVKQYKDGYFLNGKWFDGQFDNSEIIERNKVIADVIDGPHLRPIKSGQLVALTDDGCVEPVYLPDNAWSNGNYNEIEEPYETKFITYLFYGFIVILVLAILFVLALF